MHRIRTKPEALKRAIKLRAAMTDAQKKLWRILRGHQLDAHLVIELDGGQHDEGAAKDAQRTHFLNAEGYRVIRFWNNDVLQNTEGVLELIQQALAEAPRGNQPHPHPNPPPNRGRG